MSEATPSVANWTGTDGNYPLNWNYSPQSNVESSNVQSLQALWTFPVPSAPPQYSGAEGVSVTPLVVGGIVYVITSWHRIFALNAGTGGVIWFRDLPINASYVNYTQPSIPGPLGLPLGHYHQMILTSHIRNMALIWVISNSYQVFALDAYTGDIIFNFNPLTQSGKPITGNLGLYDVDTPDILIDDRRGILLFGPSVSEGESAGRGFISGWDVNSTTPSFMWRTYLIPPQNGDDPQWSLRSVENATNAYVFNGTAAVNLKALPFPVLNRTLYGDWGSFGFDGLRSYAGSGSAWGGSWSIDERLGFAYVGTNTATPDWNATSRPGLDLWSDSVLALDVETGRLVWGFQTLPHPLGDLDCAWNVILANETIGNRVVPAVIKGCKDGYIFALDASSGSMVWYLRPPSIKYQNVMMLNPLNQTEMRTINWYGFPKTGTIVQNPSDTGSLESDLAYDPTSNTIYAAVYNYPKAFPLTSVGPQTSGEFSLTNWEFDWGVNIFGIAPVGSPNSTIIAIDGSSGTVRWSHFIPNVPYRGGLTVSDGILFVSTLDGILRYLNADDGTPYGSKNIGGSLVAQPSLGQDSNGTELLFLTDTGSSRWGPVFPGFVQALEPTAIQGTTPPPSCIFYVAITGATVVIFAFALLFRRVRVH